MMIKAAMCNFLDVMRRHSRKYSRSSGSTPGATFPPAPEFSRLSAEPHHPEPGVLTKATDALTGNSFSWPEPRRGPRVNAIEAAAAVAVARSVAERLARRFERGAATGALSHPIS